MLVLEYVMEEEGEEEEEGEGEEVKANHIIAVAVK